MIKKKTANKKSIRSAKNRGILTQIFNNKLVQILAIITVLLGAGYYLVKDRLIQKSEIFVAETSNLPLATCGVKNFKVNNPCADANFSKASFTCADGSTQEFEESSCRSLNDWHNIANQACAGKCRVEDNPKPSCVPRPACLDSRPACMIALPEGQEFCPKNLPAPDPSLVPSPCSCPAGATCQFPAGCINDTNPRLPDPSPAPLE